MMKDSKNNDHGMKKMIMWWGEKGLEKLIWAFWCLFTGFLMRAPFIIWFFDNVFILKKKLNEKHKKDNFGLPPNKR